MSDLPAGWATRSIADCGQISTGNTPSTKEKKFYGSEFPYAKPSDLFGSLITNTDNHLSKEGLAVGRKVEAGAILVSCIGNLGKTGIASRKMAFNQQINAIQPHSGIEPRFLFRQIQTAKFNQALNALSSATTISIVNKGAFERLAVLIAPLNEQRRIVDKIEAMFERIDKGGENLQAARTALGLYRQSLLKSAFEGRLTADWRGANADKLEDPKTLLARIQTEREARYATALQDWQTALEAWRNGGEEGKKPAKPKRPRDIPVTSIDLGLNGWAKIPLGLMIDTPSYGTSKKCDYDGGAYGVLRIPNIGAGRIDATDLKKADFDDNEAEQYSLIEGDILTVRSNGSLSIVGKPALVTAQDTGNLFAGYLIRLRANSGSLRPQYLAHIMAEPHIRGQIEAKAKSTSGVNNISAKELQDLNIPICSPAEQSEITRILDQRLSAADTMEAEIDAALTRADALRQSILKQAFSGKLVPQDPDDEPAAALFARIKSEREAAPKPKRKKRGAA